MGSGFLRDVALRKQLEEKVKEATKNRQLAEQEVAAARALVDGGKSIDANMTEAETALADAVAAMGNKDYKAALEKATEAKERAKRTYGERARHFLESTRSMMAVTKGLGIDDAEGAQSFAKAEEALGREAFEEAVDLAQKAWKRSEKVLLERLSSSFSTAQSLIMTAKKIGKDTAAAEDLLSRARSAVEGNDFEQAIAFTKECLETVNAELREEVDRHVQDAQEAMKAAQEFGGDVTNVTRLLDRAKEDVARGEFDKALNTIKQARGESDKAVVKTLETSSARFASMLESAEAIGADVAEARAFFREVEKALKDGTLAEATTLARDGMESLNKAQFDRVAQIISSSREKFVLARNIGADITTALDSLNRARQALQAQQFAEALDYAKKADETVEQIVREFQNVEGEIRTMLRTFAQSEVLGVDTSAAKRSLERARSALGQRDFRTAVEMLRRSRDELERAQSARVMEVIQKAEFLLASAERMGASLEEPSRALEEAVTAAKSKNFPKAMELATRSRELTERAIQRALSDSVVGLNSSLQYLGEDASSVRTLVERAESALSARDFETASGYLEEAMRLAEGKTKDRALEFHGLLRAVVQLGIELGCDVTNLEAGLKSANNEVDRGRYVEVIGLKERLVKEIGVVADNVFNLVKSKVVEARNLGIDIAEMRELLKRAKMALGVEDYMESLTLLGACNEHANRTVGLHKEVYNAISSAAALVAEAKKRDVNVASALELLLEAKKAHEQFDHERALELARRAKAETEKLMILYTSAQKIINARELLDVLARLGVDAQDARTMLDTAKEAMKNKDYEKALESSEQCDKTIRERIGERITSMLSASEAVIDSLEAVDLLAQEEKLIRARELLESGDILQAVSAATSLRDEIEAIKKSAEDASVALARVQDTLSELEAMNLQAPEATATLARAQEASRASRFDDAQALAAEAALIAERQREVGIRERITRFEESIARAKAQKINTRSAEKMLAKAKEFLAQKKFRQALALAIQSEGEAEKVSLQREMAAKTVATTEKKLESFWVKIPSLQKSLDEAKALVEDGDYVKALDIAIKTGEEFGRIREGYEEALEVGKRAQRLREVWAGMGEDSSGIDGLLEKARKAVEAGDPDAARDNYQKALDAGLTLVQSAMGRRLSSAREAVSTAEFLKIDVATSQKKLSEAKALLDAEDYERAILAIEEASAISRVAVQQLAEEEMASARANLDHSRKLGADVGRAEALLAEAVKYLQSKELDKAIAAARKVKTVIPAQSDVEKPFTEKSFQAESTIRSARKFGIDVSEAERLLSQAIQAKKTDLTRALVLAQEAYDIAHRAVDQFSPRIEVKLEVKDPVAGEWAEGTLVLTNQSRALARNVRVKVLGDAEVEGLKEVPAIKAKASESFTVRVKMNVPGTIPLAIQTTSERIFDGQTFQQESIATLAVAEPAPAPPPQPIRATSESRCPVCRSVIKVGLAVRKCPHCGLDMHELCATRTANCPGCGQPLGELPKRKKMAFKVG